MLYEPDPWAVQYGLNQGQTVFHDKDIKVSIMNPWPSNYSLFVIPFLIYMVQEA